MMDLSKLYMSTIIYMEPVGKARPRHGITKQGKHVAYTPDKTAHAENLIRDQVMALEVKFYPHTPLRIEATFFRSAPKKSKARLPVTKPDWDNYAKLLTDALRRFIYEEDSQITTALIKKRYVKPGEVPRIELRMEVDDE